MGTIDKIIKLISDSIKMEEKITTLSGQLKELAKDVRDIDKRLVRIETYAEIADKLKKIS